jgi:subtilisin family serine protease
LTRYFLPDEFTVQFLKGVSKEQAEQIISQRGSRVLVEQRTLGYYTLAVPEGRGLFEAIRMFSSLAEVAFAEPSEVGFNKLLQYIPDDPDFARLWGLNNTGQTVNGEAGTADADIDAPEAWDLTRGDPDVIIAVIDTGADLDHPDLEDNILPRGAEDWDFGDPNDSVPEDVNSVSHGTHVSGTIAAVDNAEGVIGAAPACRVMPLRCNMLIGMEQECADAINYVR